MGTHILWGPDTMFLLRCWGRQILLTIGSVAVDWLKHFASVGSQMKFPQGLGSPNYTMNENIYYILSLQTMMCQSNNKQDLHGSLLLLVCTGHMHLTRHRSFPSSLPSLPAFKLAKRCWALWWLRALQSTVWAQILALPPTGWLPLANANLLPWFPDL